MKFYFSTLIFFSFLVLGRLSSINSTYAQNYGDQIKSFSTEFNDFSNTIFHKAAMLNFEVTPIPVSEIISPKKINTHDLVNVDLNLRQAYRKKQKKGGYGPVLGFFIGAGAGLALGILIDEQDNSFITNAIYTVPIGAITGAVIGARISSNKRRHRY